MTSQTNRYKLSYPDPSDLVSNLPNILKAQADSVDAALGDVDDRHTDGTWIPIVTNSLMALQQNGAVTGQIGVVGSAGSESGIYMYMSEYGQWLKISGIKELQDNKTTAVKWCPPYATRNDQVINLSRSGNIVTALGAADLKGGRVGDIASVNENLPAGFKSDQFAYINVFPSDFVLSYNPIQDNMNIRGSRLGKQRYIFTGTWTTRDPWPGEE